MSALEQKGQAGQGDTAANQAAVPDCEITPEMIRVGVDALEANQGVISEQGVVRAVYIAMKGAASFGF